MSKTEPLISVLVPSYNHGNYIEQCLLSILHQTYKNVEVIVIDDGSTDDSPAVIQALSEKYGFQYVRQSNMGLVNTLNKAAAMANGEWLAFCASDDYWHPEKLSLQVQAWQANPDVSLVYGLALQVDDDGCGFATLGAPYVGQVFDRLLYANFIPALTAMVHRPAFLHCGGFTPGYYIEDYFLWLRLAKSFKVSGINQVLGYYRVTQNRMSSNHLKMVEGEMQIARYFSTEPVMRSYIWVWKARWFNSLALNEKRQALRFLWKNFHPKLLLQPMFCKGWVKLVLSHGLNAALSNLRRRPKNVKSL